jgi:hypothetical protein
MRDPDILCRFRDGPRDWVILDLPRHPRITATGIRQNDSDAVR